MYALSHGLGVTMAPVAPGYIMIRSSEKVQPRFGFNFICHQKVGETKERREKGESRRES